MLNRACFCRLSGLIVLAFFATTAAWADNVVVVTSKTAQGPNDSVVWSQLGADATLLGSSFNATSVGGITVAGILAGANSLVSVVCAATQCSWSGSGFSAADSLLWTSDAGNSGNGPVTLVFGKSVSGAGALIQANAPGQFTAQIQAFNGATLLGTFTVTSDSAGDATYIGVQDQTAANITKVVFSITACGPLDSSGCTDFAMDMLNLTSGAVVVVTLSPRSLSFGPELVGTSSAPGSLSLINTGGAPLTINSIGISGGNNGDFGLSQSCPSPLAPAGNCLLNVTFTPTAAGPRKSSIVISSSAGGSPPSIILTGVGTAGGPSPTSLTFASQTVGTSSAAQTITFTNKGSATMNLWQIAILGANAGDFSETTTCGSTLGVGANCTVSATFKPTATGARTASVLFSDDGGGSPQSVSLTGTGS
jgi:hypothetical protein